MTNNTIVITGGATGIGLAMARYFIQHDNQVIICGRRQDRLDEAAAALPGVHTLGCDVTNPDRRLALADHIQTHFPDVNILVNNAGIQRDLDLTRGTLDLDRGESEIAVNLEAPIYLSALFTPLLSGKDNATIVNVSSALAFMVERATRCPVYCATKAGLHAFSIAQRLQLEPLSIRVVEIIPPAVESELNLESRVKRHFTSSPHMMKADDFVTQAFDQMAGDATEIRVSMNWGQK